MLLNYATVSRGPWRLKSLIDKIGRPVASRFIAVRPRSGSLEFLWALLNSPIANAYAFCHLGKRDNMVGDIRKIPMPQRKTVDEIETASANYLDAAGARANADELQTLMSRVDAAVLRQYALPVELENALLSLFTSWERVGVPFKQTGFLPEELGRQVSYADFVDYEADWSKTNRRRGELIDKKIKRTLSDSERTELDRLQTYADYHIGRSR